MVILCKPSVYFALSESTTTGSSQLDPAHSSAKWQAEQPGLLGSNDT